MKGIFISSFLLFLLLLQSCTTSRFATKKNVEKPSVQIPEVHILLSSSPVQTITFHGNFILKAPEGRYQISSGTTEYFFFFDEGALTFQSKKRRFHFKTGFPLYIMRKSSKSYFEMNGKRYIGNLIIYRIHENAISYVLVTNLENYLAGVVPAEIPTGNEDYLAAIEAQTIAARSYAYYKFRQKSNQIFHLYDDQRDQVLGDMLKANKNVLKAIRKTRGMILVSEKDSEFVPYYHSTCGGSFYSLPDESSVILDAPDSLSPAFCSLSPLYRWFRILDIRDILESLSKNGFFQIENHFFENSHTVALEVTERDHSGRVRSMKMNIDGQNLLLKDYQIRKVFIDSLQKPLPSTWFLISPFSQDSLKFLVVGAGYGHGKGMCQWGAIGMSLHGYTYEQIIRHYYPGAIIRRIY